MTLVAVVHESDEASCNDDAINVRYVQTLELCNYSATSVKTVNAEGSLIHMLHGGTHPFLSCSSDLCVSVCGTGTICAIGSRDPRLKS